MSVLDLHAGQFERAAENTKRPAPPVPPRSVWVGVLSAPFRGAAVAAGEVGASLVDAAGAIAARDNTPMIRMRGGAGDFVRDYWRATKPDPATASTAEQVLFGFARGMAKLLPATLAAGPAGALVIGAEEARSASADLMRQGVGTDAAALAGTIQGAGMASAALPLLGATLPQTAALFVAGGPGGFMAQQALTRKVLENAGHENIAASYDPFDPVGLAASTLLPGFFTWRGLRGQKLAAAAKSLPDLPRADGAAPPPVPDATPFPGKPTPVAAAAADVARGVDLQPIPRDVIDAAMVQNLRDAAARTEAAHAEAAPVTFDDLQQAPRPPSEPPPAAAIADPSTAIDPTSPTANATLAARLEQTAADVPVRLDDAGAPVRFADELAEVRRLAAEGTDDTLGTLDADLFRVAVECALSGG